MVVSLRHSGLPRSGKSGIHNHRSANMDSGLAGLRPRAGMTGLQNKTHRPQQAEFFSVENGAALGDFQPAADAAELVAVVTDEHAQQVVVAEAVDDEIGRRRNLVAIDANDAD